jgi:hypothetical protein
MRIIVTDPATDAAVNGVANGRVSHLYIGAANGGVVTLLTETARQAYNKLCDLVADGTPEDDEHLMALRLVVAGGTFAFADHPSLCGYVAGTLADMREWTAGIDLIELAFASNTVPFSGGNPADDMPRFGRTFTEIAGTFGFGLYRP